MISICIPIYNFNVTALVKKLSELCKLLDVPTELILIDDHSNQPYRKINEGVCSDHKYILLEKNVGRAAIRNQFLQYAHYDHLLFLDCDSLVTSDDFLLKYIEAIKKYPEQLICGGRVYPKKRPERSELLRWTYGVQKESMPVGERKKHPNRSFMTNNFLISKKLFNSIQFDERLINYGHEDTLFGYELKKRNIEIAHIDNPILNGDLESNENYIANTEKAIENLVLLLKIVEYDKTFIEDVTLLRTYYKGYPFRKLIQLTFVVLKPMIKYLLTKGYVNLYLFDFYKLGTLSLKLNNTPR